ncbi:hypothetical protein L9F63_000144, partial [Diploptera punctata]
TVVFPLFCPPPSTPTSFGILSVIILHTEKSRQLSVENNGNIYRLKRCDWTCFPVQWFLFNIVEQAGRPIFFSGVQNVNQCSMLSCKISCWVSVLQPLNCNQHTAKFDALVLHSFPFSMGFHNAKIYQTVILKFLFCQVYVSMYIIMSFHLILEMRGLFANQ